MYIYIYISVQLQQERVNTFLVMIQYGEKLHNCIIISVVYIDIGSICATINKPKLFFFHAHKNTEKICDSIGCIAIIQRNLI